MERVAVIGGGAWGTALASVIARKGNPVLHWMRNADNAEDINIRHENRHYLPGIKLSPLIHATASPEDIKNCSVLFLVVPTQALRAVLQSLHPHFPTDPVLILCSKGIERTTGLFPSEVAEEIVPHARIAVLSGPSFADDVVRGLPTAVTLACRESSCSEYLARSFSDQTFRIYHGTDMQGVEIGGAAKNVYALGCGAIIGKGLGESAKAALIARSFAELQRFALSRGAKAETLMGLSGLGDLLLTCNSPQSRNFSAGLLIGKGRIEECKTGGKLAEGIFTAPALIKTAEKEKLDMPIACNIAALLENQISLDEVITTLLSRPVKPE